MFSSAAIGGGLFAGGAGTGPAASAAGTTRAAGSPPPGLPAAPGATDVPRVSKQPERSSPAGREPRGSPAEQPQPDIKASISELLHRPTKGLGKGAAADGESDLSFSALGAGTEPTSYGLDGTTSTSAHVAASPFGAVSGGGHFGGAFGSALFPVSTHQGGAARGHGGLGGADGPGADLSVDPFANSSGALARMLGVTLPPVDSHSSLARKMRSGVGVPPVGGAMQQDTSPSRSHVPPRGGGAYADFSRDMDRGRPGGHGGPGKTGVRDASGVERGGGARHEYGDNQKGGGALQDNHQASRFSFAQEDNPGMPFSPARGSPQMGPDPRGSPGGMGSPSHPGQHHHLHHHHQSHAHRPFGGAGQGAGQSVTPPRLGEFGGGAEGHFAPPPPPHHHHPHHGQHHFHSSSSSSSSSDNLRRRRSSSNSSRSSNSNHHSSNSSSNNNNRSTLFKTGWLSCRRYCRGYRCPTAMPTANNRRLGPAVVARGKDNRRGNHRGKVVPPRACRRRAGASGGETQRHNA
ncbi:unnamed protein product [Ectocarpus fasciculatus]